MTCMCCLYLNYKHISEMHMKLEFNNNHSLDVIEMQSVKVVCDASNVV